MTDRLNSDRLNRIQGWMDSYVADRKYAGCATLVCQSGEELWFGTAGLRDVADDLPWQRDTVARIYSMTKPVTSLALMQLVEQGRVQLDAPVSEFIPEFSHCRALLPGATSLEETEPCAAPTLHQLLTHTSGLTYPFNPGPLTDALTEAKMAFYGAAESLEAECKRLAQFPLAFKPGARWEYSVGIDVILN